MAKTAEDINPYTGDNREKSKQVREMFDNIAPAYDFMNRAMTLGVDKMWRLRAVNLIKKHLGACPGASILDVATGTADLAISLARKIEGSHVTGIDLAANMVEIGKRKVAEAGLEQRISLEVGDCLALPYADATFDCVTVAYGVRNFQRLAAGYREMLRVLRPGGMLCVIELSTPTSPVVKPLYKLYTTAIIPAIGRMVSHDARAYSYLPESIAAVAQGSDMTALIESAGFKKAKFQPLTFGVCTIYTAEK